MAEVPVHSIVLFLLIRVERTKRTETDANEPIPFPRMAFVDAHVLDE